MTKSEKPASKTVKPSAKKAAAPRKSASGEARPAKEAKAEPGDATAATTVKTKLHPSAPWPFPTGKRP